MHLRFLATCERNEHDAQANASRKESESQNSRDVMPRRVRDAFPAMHCNSAIFPDEHFLMNIL
jgi:hypothetical protein